MPVLNTPQELLAALGQSAFSADPFAELARKGYTLSPSLEAQRQSALAGRHLAPAPTGVTPGSFKGKLTFQSAPQAPAVPLVAPGNYDVVAGLTLDLANDALGKIYESGSIPHQIAVDQLLSQTELTALGGLFQVDKPGGQISRLHITGAPTLSSIADGSSEVTLKIPIQLDWVHERWMAGRQIRQLITKAVGTLQLTMRAVTNVVARPETSSSTMTLGVQLVTDVSGPADSPRLILDPNSPVKLTSPAPPNQIDGTAVLIQNALARQFNNSLTWSVSPQITLPTGSLEIHHIDVVTNGGVLLAGIQVGTQSASDPSQLASLLPNADTNIFLQIQDTVPKLLIHNALESGALTAMAKQQHDNAVIDSADAWFESNAFVAQMKGRLVDECPLNVDLGFIYTRKATIKLNAGSIEIDQTDDQSIAEASNLWCLLTTLGLIGLAALGAWIIGGWALVAAGAVIGMFFLPQAVAGGPDISFINLTMPIPDTDYLPTLNNSFINVTNGVMLIASKVVSKLDDVNTVIYAKFLVPDGGIVVGETKPLAGVKVELMDQDVPAPAGDDASTTVPHDSSSSHGNLVTTKKHTFIKPGADQKLAEGTTDLDGVVRFSLLKDQLTTTAGRIKTVVTQTNIETGAATTEVSDDGVVEQKPDLYFRVSMPDGSIMDTRNLPNGFFLNFSSSRIGTLSNPLTFGASTPVVFGG